MTQGEAVVGGMIDSHDNLSDLLGDASAAAALLVMNPASDEAMQHWRTGQRFIECAVQHMSDEEDDAFVTAASCGVARETLDSLRWEHATLRFLAARILARYAPDDDAALELLRFVDRFEKHVAREEWTFATCLRPSSVHSRAKRAVK